MISLIINTNCLGESAQGLSSGKQPYANRAYLLRNFIIPHAKETSDEVIVAGEFEEGEGYKYIPFKGVHNNCTDALLQRQAGFEASKGNTVVFQHDDHYINDALFRRDIWIGLFDLHGVISPARYTRLRNSAGERLNAGENIHINGHCAVYSRDVITACPWSAVPSVFVWDMEHTSQVLDAGFTIEWSNDIRCWDIEYGSEPWK